MSHNLFEIFEDKTLVEKIKSRLPYLFQLAELECSRAGKIGMQVGSLRETIIVSLLIYKFGEDNVETQIPITEPEVDAMVFGEPISIKTITGKRLGGVKLIWTVDAEKAKEFRDNYYPSCDMLLIQLNWGSVGAFYYIPLNTQRKLFNIIGRINYIKLPKPGTNPRGVEITKEALNALVTDPDTKNIPIDWEKVETDYDPYKRWIDFWREE
jgi:hypothetical protein